MTTEPPFTHRVHGRPLRIVVAGAGAMGLAWARAVHLDPRFDLVAVVDTDIRRAKGLTIRLRKPGTPVAASLDLLPEVAADACVNATPPDAHHQVILSALRGGLSVLTEKPFTGHLDQAVALTREARSTGRLLMVGQSRRHQPGTGHLKSAIGRLGSLDTLSTEFGRDYPATGFRARLAQPLLTDMAVHAFDTARFLTGARAVSVRCDTVSHPDSGYAGPPQANALFTMSDGSRFHYSGSWHRPDRPTPWGGRWRAEGPGGSAEWDGAGQVRSEPVDRSLADPVTFTAHDAAFDENPVAQVSPVLGEFAEALATGTVPWGEAADNLRTVAMVHSAIAAAQSGSEAQIDDLDAALEDGSGAVR
ncbi:Gfo/Idh/MocA family protein [Streptomyces hainanensis]|uniref:Gfo/Idh/MocA family oxidoreductase n=1 Tax=Streptomyces hainanensis TaxID=402648 RepID=A0A4R4TR33_9ACTN|nr:Gfo/Idh/MocA family oxidoreductase [Streptomyces hainanensis]TDC79216.1 Gfo/Idh/MocA family oxidoreductase [Streptomyces hainanensis]